MNVKNQESFVFYSDELEAKSVGGKYFVEGYITTGDLDLVNDIVTKAGMDDITGQLSNRNIKLDWEHETMVGKSNLEMQVAKSKLPLGRIVSYEKDSKGIKVKAELNSNWKRFDSKGDVVQTFSEVWSSIKNKFLDAFSIAYVLTRTKSRDLIGGKTARLLDGINLINVAITGNAINPSATMTAVMAKSVDFMESKALSAKEKTKIEKEAEKEAEEDDDEPEKDGDKKKPKEKESKSNSLKNKQGDNMAEEEKKEVQEEATEESTEATQEETQEETKEETTEAEPEQKANDNLEVKNKIVTLEKKNVELEKQVKELKAVMEKVNVKALGTEAQTETNETESSKGPLDLI